MNNLSIPAPLYRDPIYDGPSDPVMIWNRTEKCWWLIYTQRRSTEVAIGVSNVFGSALGVASSADGQYWTYRGTIPGLDLNPGHNTFWAPEVVWLNGHYHMYVTYIQGIQFDWDHGYKPSKLAHFISDDQWHWEFESFSQVSERPVIDACVHEIAPGQFKMWFKEDNNTYAAVSDDLCRWWLADPEGNAFLSTGVDCVNPGVETRVDVMREFIPDLPPRTEEFAQVWSQKGPFEFANFGIANLIHAFGANWWESWAKISKNYLLEQGFNTIGNWSQPEFIRWANMPYVLPMAGFPGTKDMIFRDFPDVFDPEFAHNSQIFAQQLAPLSGDRNLIGYFLRNEPEWAFVYDLCIAEELLAHPKPLVSKYALMDWLRKKYETPENWSAAWGKKFAEFKDVLIPIHRASRLSAQAAADLKEFSEEMIRRYVTLPSRECRKTAPNHMNLGMRYAYITDKSLLAGYENFDVFSINSYQISPFEQVEQVGRLLDKPVMIGEFHHGALDRGLSATGIRGVASQEERAVAYQYYMEQGAASRYFVGAHYFQFNDQSALGRFDGENYQIGLVDVCMRKYPEIARGIRECHSRIYMVANGQLPAYSRRPEEIPALHY